MGVILGICCILSYLLGDMILSNYIVNDYIDSLIRVIFILIPVCIYYFVIKRIIDREDSDIYRVSDKVIDIVNINNKYSFREITRNKYKIYEREYSRRSLDRVTGDSVILYNIENNIKDIRTNIESAIYNISMLDNYTKDINDIISRKSINNSKYKDSKYYRIEKRVINKLIRKRKDFLITARIEVNYRSNGGKVNESRYGKYEYLELVRVYDKWNKGKRYAETIKQERKIMNDDIRYNVLKRDNYTCKLCGAKASDGARLHVDHIIPVSKGGKTVMSNLQTLCERCNMGKSNKMDTDIICPLCGGIIVKKKGKYGSFYGCSNYPRCKYVKK